MANLRSALEAAGTVVGEWVGAGGGGLQEAGCGRVMLLPLVTCARLHTFPVQGQRAGILDLLLTNSTATT